MLKKETFVLLRIPFSIFLLPVFLFAWSQTPESNGLHVLAVFLIFHVLVYPASNGYNSFHDRDTESIGGLKSPPLPTKQLLWLVSAMDILAVVLASQFSFLFGTQVATYILASRLYSNRTIRFKKYPVFGFVWVSFFQGAFVYWAVQTALGGTEGELAAFSSQPWAKLLASVLLGAVYPLTQIYQHDSDKRDGVHTLSMMLGYRGTFVFTALFFGVANMAAWFHFNAEESIRSFWVMQLFFIPVTIYFVYWFVKVWKDERAADFDHAMRMNLLASLCLNLCYASFILSQ